MRTINNKFLPVVLVMVTAILCVLMYFAGDTTAQTASTIGLNSPTTFPVDI